MCIVEALSEVQDVQNGTSTVVLSIECLCISLHCVCFGPKYFFWCHSSHYDWSEIHQQTPPSHCGVIHSSPERERLPEGSDYRKHHFPLQPTFDSMLNVKAISALENTASQNCHICHAKHRWMTSVGPNNSVGPAPVVKESLIASLSCILGSKAWSWC